MAELGESVVLTAIETLRNGGFTLLGSWRTPNCRPHKLGAIRYVPGLYAFVVGDDVRYIGKADTLHRRLRNYGNRAFRNGARPQRGVHEAIEPLVRGGTEVLVYVCPMPGSLDPELRAAETALLIALQPEWNRTYRRAETVEDVSTKRT